MCYRLPTDTFNLGHNKTQKRRGLGARHHPLHSIVAWLLSLQKYHHETYLISRHYRKVIWKKVKQI